MPEETTAQFPCPLCDVFPWETPLDMAEHLLSAHTLDDVKGVRARGSVQAPSSAPDGWVQVPSNFGNGVTTRRRREDDPPGEEAKATLRDLLKRLEGNEDAEAIRDLANIGRQMGNLRDGTVQGWIRELRAMLPDPAHAERSHPLTGQTFQPPAPERASTGIPDVPEGTYRLDEGRWGVNTYTVTKGRRRQFVKKVKNGEALELSNAAQIAVLHRIADMGPEVVRLTVPANG